MNRTTLIYFLGWDKKMTFSHQWINVETGELHGSEERLQGGKRLEITTPDEGSEFGWAATSTK